MATLGPQTVNDAGTEITLAPASAGGDQFPWSPNRALVVLNGSGAPINVTLVAARPCNQGVSHDKVVAVPAGKRYSFKAIDRNRYVDTNGYVQVLYSATATVTVGVEEV